MHPALSRFLVENRALLDALTDSWFVVDADRNVVDFNRAFYSLLPRQVARSLKEKKCYEALELSICKERCAGVACWQEKRHVRLDEIEGRPAGTETRMRFVVTAVPILDETGAPAGALEIQRNVTDEALVQAKYKEILDQEARERERLATQIRSRTKELLETNQALLRTQRELLAYKRGLKL
jgi:PAS domain-containing protein